MERMRNSLKKILISLTCLVFLVVLIGNVKVAESATLVVDNDNSTSNCVDGGSAYTTIQEAVDAAADGDTITVCPGTGTYEENITITKESLTIQAHSQNPSDTTIKSVDSTKNVILMGSLTTISGFKITGATGDSCSGPCAAIRAYCTHYGNIMNNYITGNNRGVLIRDTGEGWDFSITIEDNEIVSNTIGVELHYGHYSTVRDNYISGNDTTGIEMIDTWGNTIVGNTIESNELGIKLGSEVYSPGYATRDNIIYQNEIIDNTVQVLDDAPCPTGEYQHYWYEPTLLEGNYWSDYTGVDDGSGTGKHAISGDGIGDTQIPYPDTCDEYPYVDLAYWPMDEGSGNIIYDQTPNQLDGLLGTPPSDPTWVSDISGYALQFDGDDYVDVLDKIDPPTLDLQDMTLTAWIKYTTAQDSIILSGVDGNTKRYALMLSADGGIRGYFDDLNPWDTGVTSTKISPDTWTPVALTKKGSEVKLYIDRKLESTTYHDGAIGSVSNVSIGGDPVIGSYFTGTIDEVKMSGFAKTYILVKFEADPACGNIPLTVQFTDLSEYNVNDPSWLWDFGDGGEPSTLQNPTHIYTTEGLYLVTLTISGNGGFSSKSLTKLVGDNRYLCVPDASFIGEKISDRSGFIVSSAGDVNGDGKDDILISAQGNDDGGDNAGKVYLILGKATDWSIDTPLSTANASFIGENEGDRLGNASSAGDVNGDGKDDILIGAANNDDGGNGAGKVYLILGRKTEDWSMNMPLSTADASFIGENQWDMLGNSVSSAGNVNNDSYDDILIGAFLNNDGGGDAGKTYLILGRKTEDWSINMPLSTAVASFIGENAWDQSGRYVSSAGNVNNDSYDDILIGTHYAGKTYLIFGKETGWSINMNLSNANASFIGASGVVAGPVSSAGDVDNNGYDDILIGEYENDDGGSNAGKTYLILSKPTSSWSINTSLSTADASFIGENEWDTSGRSVSSAGDVNGDGYDDILIGASGNDDGGNGAGKTYLILGKEIGWSPDTFLSTADAFFIGENEGDFSGSSVSSAGDVNNDGYDDILIGAYGGDKGKTYLILGPGNAPDITVTPTSIDFGSVNVGSSSDSTVTVSNDGTGNLIIGPVTSPSSPFSIVIDNCSNQTLEPSATCTIIYRFSPTSVNTFTSNSDIPSNDPDENPATISLSGIGINNPPTADPDGPYSGTEGQAITLDGSGSSDSDGSIELYEWDIDNDGTYDYSSSSPTQSHTYAQQGAYSAYTIKLRVTDNLGATDEATTTADILDTSPTASFTASPASGTEPLTVDFTDTSTAYDGIASRSWNFGDGSPAGSGSSVSHTYIQDGTYTATLTVTDGDGSTDTETTIISVSDTLPTADFTGSPTSGEAPLTVNFTDNSTGYDQPLSYDWDFDNNGSIDSTAQNPPYTYNEGTYTVKLTVTDSDGSTNSLTRTDYITVTPAACANPPVKIVGGASYLALQDAYDASTDLDTIQSQDTSLTGDLNINQSILVTMQAGYDCDFTGITGATELKGYMIINKGKLIINKGKLIIQ